MKMFIKTVFVFLGLFAATSSEANVASVQRFIQNNPDSLILFYRPGCPYCHYVLPLFTAVQADFGTISLNVAFLKVDISTDAHLKEAFGFHTVPTFIYYKNGIEQFRHGSNNKTLTIAQIEANIERYIL